MLTFTNSLLGVLLTILVVIGIHELGHFCAAKFLGVKVLRFSIGFGKPLFLWRDRSGTEYALAMIPLGGYVKMLGEHSGNVSAEDWHRAYHNQPLRKKIAITVAGPLANFFFAFVLYWLLFVTGFTSVAPIVGTVLPNSIAAEAGIKPQQEIISIDHTSVSSWMSVAMQVLLRTGDADYLTITTKTPPSQTLENHLLNLTGWHMHSLKPDPLNSLGIVPYRPIVPAIVGKVNPSSSAAQSELQVGDQIISLNNIAMTNWFQLISFLKQLPKDKIALTKMNNNAIRLDNIPITNWVQLAVLIDQLPTKDIEVTVLRKGAAKTFPVRTDYELDWLFQEHGVLGITPAYEWPNYMLRKNQYGPTTSLSYAGQQTADFIFLNFVVIGKIISGKISLQSLGGPLSIFQNAASTINEGATPFLNFLAFLSISIGVMNIFPVPGLDGGHLLLQLIEAILNRSIPERVVTYSYRLGILVLLVLAFQAVANDFFRAVS